MSQVADDMSSEDEDPDEDVDPPIKRLIEDINSQGATHIVEGGDGVWIIWS